LCEGQPDACERCNQKERDFCLALATLRDRDLFSFLAEGERSGIFESSSEILRQYHENRVEFFYLNVGGEIARLEVPQWVTAQRQLLDLVHTLTVDQCQRSTGFPPYPPCLLEAHEQAVITASSRQLVQDMVAQALVQHGQTAICSAKDDSKRRRGV